MDSTSTLSSRDLSSTSEKTLGDDTSTITTTQPTTTCQCHCGKGKTLPVQNTTKTEYNSLNTIPSGHDDAAPPAAIPGSTKIELTDTPTPPQNKTVPSPMSLTNEAAESTDTLTPLSSTITESTGTPASTLSNYIPTNLARSRARKNSSAGASSAKKPYDKPAKNDETPPGCLIEGMTWACQACTRGHRTGSCVHALRKPMAPTKGTGRPSNGTFKSPWICRCGQKPCICTWDMWFLVRVPETNEYSPDRFVVCDLKGRPLPAEEAAQRKQAQQELGQTSCCHKDTVAQEIQQLDFPVAATAASLAQGCNCGPNCKCTLCIAHPNNQQSREYAAQLFFQSDYASQMTSSHQLSFQQDTNTLNHCFGGEKTYVMPGNFGDQIVPSNQWLTGVDPGVYESVLYRSTGNAEPQVVQQSTFNIPQQPTFNVPQQPTFNVPQQLTFNVPQQPNFDAHQQPTFNVPSYFPPASTPGFSRQPMPVHPGYNMNINNVTPAGGFSNLDFQDLVVTAPFVGQEYPSMDFDNMDDGTDSNGFNNINNTTFDIDNFVNFGGSVHS